MTKYTVLENDDGIRPAGAPDECFYCNKKVGDTHSDDCVVIRGYVVYDVEMSGLIIGTYTTSIPHSWDDSMAEFHKNDSGWCQDSCLSGGGLDSMALAIVQAKKNTIDADGCLCGSLKFRLSHRSGIPFRKVRDSDD